MTPPDLRPGLEAAANLADKLMAASDAQAKEHVRAGARARAALELMAGHTAHNLAVILRVHAEGAWDDTTPTSEPSAEALEEMRRE